MKFFWIILLFLGVGGMVGAQPGIQWQKTLGGTDYDQARSLLQTIDGGFVVAGYTASEDGDVVGSHGGTEIWVIKLDSTGIVQWKKAYGGSNNEWANSIQQTNDNGFVVAGFTESNDGDVSGNHGDKDMWVLKLDSVGNIQWQKTLGGSYWEEAWSVEQTTDGGYILLGRANSIDGDVTGNNGSLDYWVVKLNNIGDLVWQKSLGGSGLDLGYTITQTQDEGYIAIGESNSQDGDIGNPLGSNDYWVVKLNFEGKILWEKSIGGTSSDRGNKILQTREGGFILFGQSYSTNGDVTGNHGNTDCWAVKLSINGSIEWQKAMGGSNQGFGQSIQQTLDGGYILAGDTGSTDGDVSGNNGGVELWVIKLTESGMLEWQKPMGGTSSEGGFSIQQTSDGGYIVAGEAWSKNGDVTGNQGKTDFWIIKLSPVTSPTTTISAQTLQLYPNPTQNTLSIKRPTSLTPNAALSLKVTDLLGREVLQKSGLEGSLGSVDLDVTSLPGGVYLLQMSSLEGEIWVGKFQKL